ncbi:MAG: hypothetical protein K0Q55_3826, partial [Verrucomicrobia bacterium]|nr:hypothetical protein [Verrucomicrobiota bacterium]
MAINAVLLILLVASLKSKRDSTPIFPAEVDNKSAANSSQTAAKAAAMKKEKVTVTNVVHESFTWSDLESPDYHEYIR